MIAQKVTPLRHLSKGHSSQNASPVSAHLISDSLRAPPSFTAHCLVREPKCHPGKGNRCIWCKVFRREVAEGVSLLYVSLNVKTSRLPDAI